MKSVILILLAVILVVVAKEARKPLHYDLDEAPKLFQQFVIRYKKRYKNGKDVQVHFDAFKDNLEQMNRQNEARFPNEVFSIDQFSDLTVIDKKQYPTLFKKISGR